jgi:hypothetical protein
MPHSPSFDLRRYPLVRDVCHSAFGSVLDDEKTLLVATNSLTICELRPTMGTPMRPCETADETMADYA